MFHSLSLLAVLLPVVSTASASFLNPCTLIEAVTPGTEVFYPGSQQYANDIYHPTNSSSEVAKCSVEPSSVADVSKILLVLAVTQSQFGVKGGGHAYNVHHSSTTGVEISMVKFNQVTYNKKAASITLGTGLTWDEVYNQLDGTGVVVPGGRVPGVGVAGLSLGGGYSWQANQVGLTIDNVLSYEIVLPTGLVVTASANSESDLFWALKGGWNNFGIVTAITYKAIPQGQIWGGQCDYAQGFDVLTAAAANFQANNTDPKAAILFTYVFAQGANIINLQMFYDGPTPPKGIFDTFLNAPSLFCGTGTQSFAAFLNSLPNVLEKRGQHDTVPLTGYSVAFLNAMLNETSYWASELGSLDSSLSLAYTMEPFLPSVLSHAAEGSSAYPPTRATAYYPSSIDWSYSNASLDSKMQASILQSVATLRAKAAALGQPVATGKPNVSKYGNYAHRANTKPADIWGSNVNKLEGIRFKYDPFGIMQSLTGGWKYS